MVPPPLRTATVVVTVALAFAIIVACIGAHDGDE